MKKIIREKDGKLLEITEWAYNEMKKSSFKGFRDYNELGDEVISIKSTKPVVTKFKRK